MTCAAARAEPPAYESPTPAYLPRAAWAGLYIGPGAIWQVRVQWLLTVAQEKISALALTVEGGGGYALGRPDGLGPAGNARLTFMYEHVALAGLAYRADRPSGFHWGFSVTTGPVFYGARFDSLRKENVSGGLVEGRLQAGWKFDKVRVGLTGGVAQPYEYPRHRSSARLIGGPILGVFAEWR